MRPLKTSELTATTAKRMNAKTNIYIRKWLGFPAATEEHLHKFRLEKTRLVLKLNTVEWPLSGMLLPKSRQAEHGGQKIGQRHFQTCSIISL